ncbi:MULTISPECIES: hypothetical protein [Acinetobacter]|uniref:hypothetical protein n=1 Tax=Acinetobacter TaxID=469 RepID=UPI0013796B93|nr:hypothetical protein [Acinetobacter kanungonis]NCI78437.1 hypothetical protein [Acinetobacter kanungonis]
MLEFWFDPKIAVFKKLALLVLLGSVTAALYWMQPLQPDAILMFMGTGIVFLICRYCKIHFAAKNPTGLFYRVLTWIPLALLLALIFMHLQSGDILIPGAQGIGFMTLAICLFSPLSLLNQHKQDQH